MTFATLSSKGQLTVPASARKELGLTAGSRVMIEMRDRQIIIRAPQDLFALRGFLGKAKSPEAERKAMAAEAAKRSKGEL